MPINVNSSTYIDFDKESNKEDPKTEVGHDVRILKYQNIFGKGCTPIWSEEVFVMNKVENTVSWKYIISYPNGEEIVGMLQEKELQKTNQKEFKVEKEIKRKGDKLYVKWKGYDNSCNSWINKKDIV